ncbi:MAG: hypothetical protein HXY38_15000 [Chloroflexi bacterium]|nr:hypothetical protein [Chloroflexota bacterium]
MGRRSREYAAEWRLAMTQNDLDRAIHFEQLLMTSLTQIERRVYNLCHIRATVTARDIAAASSPPIRRENVHRTLEALCVYGLVKKVGKQPLGKTFGDVYEVAK